MKKRGKKHRSARREKDAQCMRVNCTKGEAMQPTAHAMHIPDDLHLERRQVCYPTHDEPMLIRDAEGHVYAVVEAPPESLAPTN